MSETGTEDFNLRNLFSVSDLKYGYVRESLLNELKDKYESVKNSGYCGRLEYLEFML